LLFEFSFPGFINSFPLCSPKYTFFFILELAKITSTWVPLSVEILTQITTKKSVANDIYLLYDCFTAANIVGEAK